MKTALIRIKIIRSVSRVLTLSQLIENFNDDAKFSHLSLALKKQTCFFPTFSRLPYLDVHLFCSTVEPPLSDHPLLSGQLSKSRNYCQCNTVNETSIKQPRPPFGRPDVGFYYIYPYQEATHKLRHVHGFVLEIESDD